MSSNDVTHHAADDHDQQRQTIKILALCTFGFRWSCFSLVALWR